jgi:Ca2+-binding RTX toxin-like protein
VLIGARRNAYGVRIMHSIKRLSVLGGLAVGMLAATPAAGHAAAGEPVVTRSGSIVTITAGAVAKNDNLTLQAVSGRLHVFGGVVAGTGCGTVSANEVNCGTGVATVYADLGAGQDRFSSLTGITGTVNGGADDDLFSAGRGSDGTGLTFRGGLGRDTVDYGASGTGVTVTKGVSSQPDGRPGLDADDVAVDVEVVRGTVRDDTLVGSAGADTLIGDQGADTLDGKGGADVLNADDIQGTKDKSVDCGTGADNAIADPADVLVGCESVGRP